MYLGTLLNEYLLYLIEHFFRNDVICVRTMQSENSANVFRVGSFLEEVFSGATFLLHFPL